MCPRTVCYDVAGTSTATSIPGAIRPPLVCVPQRPRRLPTAPLMMRVRPAVGACVCSTFVRSFVRGRANPV